MSDDSAWLDATAQAEPVRNITGQPAISLRFPVSATGLPVGVQLVAAYGREEVLIRLAAQAVAPCTGRRPLVSAGA